MAKHPVPKHRSTSTRSRRRHSTFLKITLKKLNNFAKLVACPSCQAPRLSHVACPECGEYRGRKVVLKKTAKVTKVSA